jgi:N-methylhydantoinase B
MNPPCGVRGGSAGGRADQKLRHVNGSEVPLDPCAMVHLSPGEIVISVGAGGGGYGSPLERDPQAVAEAVREGLVTRARAERVYGVVLTEDDAVEPGETAARRAVRT